MSPDVKWTLISQVFISVMSTLAVGLAFLAKRQSGDNALSIREVHLSLNSRLDQLLKASADVARAQGHEAGMRQAENGQSPTSPIPKSV